MPSASSLTPDSRFMGLFVGPKHSGKTAAAASFYFPDNSQNVLFEEFDGRIRGLLGCPWLDLKRIEYNYFPPFSGENRKTVMERLNAELDVLQIKCRKDNPYTTLVLDSLTSMTACFIADSVPLTHAGGKGKSLGTLNMAGPEDYGFEATATSQVMAFLRSVPIKNVIVIAHVVDRFGKANPDDSYSESIVVGEKLSIRDKIAANSMIYFDHIFRFNRKMQGNKERFYVRFKSDFACTSFQSMPDGEIEITGKPFYPLMLSYANEGMTKAVA